MTGDLWIHVQLNAKYIMKIILTSLWVNFSFPTNCIFIFYYFFFSKITVDFYTIIFLLKNDLLWSSETIQEAEKFSPSGNPKAE